MNSLRLLLLCVFILSPFIDLYNGFVQQILNTNTIIPMLFKAAIIVFCIRFIVYRNKASLFLFLLLYLYVFHFFYWGVSGYINSTIDALKSLSKLIYPYCILLFFYAYKRKLSKDVLLDCVLLYGLIIASSIIITKSLGIGVPSYGDDYGYGAKGFFKAGNDIGLSLIMCTCISSYLIAIKGNVKYIVSNVLLISACFIVGSVACLFGAFISVVVLILQPLFTKDKCSKLYYMYKKVLLILALPVMFYLLLYIVNIDDYNRNKFDIYYLLSGGARSTLEDAFYFVYSNFSSFDMILGVGQEEFYSRIANYFNGYLMQRSVEVDHLDLLGIYGILLGGIIFVFPLLYLYLYIKNYLRNRDSFSYWMISLFLLFVFHGLFAGHAFTSISAMTVLIPVMFLAEHKL